MRIDELIFYSKNRIVHEVGLECPSDPSILKHFCNHARLESSLHHTTSLTNIHCPFISTPIRSHWSRLYYLWSFEALVQDRLMQSSFIVRAGSLFTILYMRVEIDLLPNFCHPVSLDNGVSLFLLLYPSPPHLLPFVTLMYWGWCSHHGGTGVFFTFISPISKLKSTAKILKI